jgi:hypothetical protein
MIALRLIEAFEGTEFSGGRLTGPLLRLLYVGGFLFLSALVLAFLRPRIAAAAGLVASLFCLPLYLYRLAPGLFPGDYSVAPSRVFAWDGWAASGIMIGLAILYFAKAGMAHAKVRQPLLK